MEHKLILKKTTTTYLY